MARIMALDVGERRIGVAVSDPLGVIARSLGVIRWMGDREAVAQEIGGLIVEHGVSRLVVGYPRSMSGDAGPQARQVETFVQSLKRVVAVPIEFWDERLSTVTAAHLLRERGQTARQQKESIDAVAAAVILQDYLDAQQLRTEESDDEELDAEA